MLAYILLCCTVYFCQLALRQPQVFISETHQHAGNFTIVLIEYYFIFFRSSLCRECD